MIVADRGCISASSGGGVLRFEILGDYLAVEMTTDGVVLLLPREAVVALARMLRVWGEAPAIADAVADTGSAHLGSGEP